MAPPATKRRKIRHDDGSDSSERGSGDFSGDASGPSDDGGDETGEVDGDTSMEDIAAFDETQSLDDEDIDSGIEDARTIMTENAQKTAAKADKAKHSNKRQEIKLQDGIYTAEVYKSNMFKLQMDELLDQVKLKYGKKEAPAENAMRTLKSLIEQLPSRPLLSVCIYLQYTCRLC